MKFKGRTVLAFVLIAMFASSVLTLALQDVFGSQGSATSAPIRASSQMKALESIYDIIDQNYISKTDQDILIRGAINGMISSLDDPYSVYMDLEEAKQFQESLSSQFSGIGAEVAMENDNITVVSPIKGYVFVVSVILLCDVLVSVNGESLAGLSLNEAVLKIRGPKGTEAKLGIIRVGNTTPVELVVIRDDIKIETVYSEMMDDQIGMIQIASFAEKTSERFHEDLSALEEQGMQGLIIDLRNDPGGILQVVEEISQSFVPAGEVILQTENREGERGKLISKGSKKPYPVTVLINQGSASASEILAAAIQQSADGYLIGETTFGKGTVQTNYSLGDGSSVKLTIAKWLTPDGTWIHRDGIEPDLTVEQPEFFRAAPLPEEPNLTLNMNNGDVRNLQLILMGLEMDVDRQDGYFSEKTELAVRAFQKNNALPVTGVVDQQTARMLEKSMIEAIRDPENDLQLKAAFDYLQNLLNP